MITFNHHTACELVPASQRAASRAQRNAFLIVGTSFCRATTFTSGLSHWYFVPLCTVRPFLKPPAWVSSGDRWKLSKRAPVSVFLRRCDVCLQNWLVFTAIHSCNISRGCNTYLKQDGSTSVFHSWQGVLFMKHCSSLLLTCRSWVFGMFSCCGADFWHWILWWGHS